MAKSTGEKTLDRVPLEELQNSLNARLGNGNAKLFFESLQEALIKGRVVREDGTVLHDRVSCLRYLAASVPWLADEDFQDPKVFVSRFCFAPIKSPRSNQKSFAFIIADGITNEGFNFPSYYKGRAPREILEDFRNYTQKSPFEKVDLDIISDFIDYLDENDPNNYIVED